jgi:hypothetical protein
VGDHSRVESIIACDRDLVMSRTLKYQHRTRRFRHPQRSAEHHRQNERSEPRPQPRRVVRDGSFSI